MISSARYFHPIKLSSILSYQIIVSKALSTMSTESAKKAAAVAAVDEFVKSNFSVGIGSGSTIVYAVKHLGALLKNGSLNSITCVPTSFQSRQLLFENGITVADLEQCPVLDVAIDGADEIDQSLNCIKGGGGCHLQEKCVAYSAKKFVLVADHTKNSRFLGERWAKGIPLEVLPLAYFPVKAKIESTFGGRAILRMAEKKAGPVVTDNGNFVLDWQFPIDSNRSTHQWIELNTALKLIPGVLETGLFINMAEKAFVGSSDGHVIVLQK